MEPDKEFGSKTKRCAACDLVKSNIGDRLVAVEGILRFLGLMQMPLGCT